MSRFPNAATIAVTDHVGKDVSEASENHVQELHRMFEDCPGFLSAYTVRHTREHQVEYTVQLRFTDADAAQGWRNRPEITAKLAEITALTWRGGADR
jgi:antibiotic biosynthesis monooxygenase (ABM) superfamily enzyme